MAFVERSVRARVGGTPRRSTVSVSCRPSRRLAAAPGWVRSSSLAIGHGRLARFGLGRLDSLGVPLAHKATAISGSKSVK
jgi:hypothetical protein